MKNLEETYKMIARKLPVTARSGKERDGRYYMKDNFLDFWFRFVETRRNLKEIAKAGEAFVEIWEQLPVYEGRKLEDMAIRKMIEENLLGIHFTRAGKYWDRKGTVEMDAVFMDDREHKVYLFKVKTNRQKIRRQQLEDLQAKAGTISEFRGYEILLGISYIDESGLKIEIV